MNGQQEFDLEQLGLRLEPTIAMQRGEQAVFQHAYCGTVVVQSSLAPGPLGACPATGCKQPNQGWWQQTLPVAGLHPIPNCDVAWVETDPALPHDDHTCVFRTTSPHTRHECRCGLNLHDHEVCS